MDDVYYERYLSQIYDDTPYFGQARSREPDKFNGFYFENLKNRSRRVLEFGPGTGMLTVPLAKAGYKLDSVDISPDMHDVLSAKLSREDPSVAANVNQILGDATVYQGPEPYESIVMPEGILIAIPDRDLQFALLENCHRNLQPGGRLYTDFFQPRYKIIHQKVVEEHTRFTTRSGDDYLLSMTFDNDEYTQIQKWHCVFTRQSGPAKGERTEVDVTFRYLFVSEIDLMLRLAGFKVIQIDIEFADRRGFAVIAEKI